jgi:hypothetical protein
MGFSVTRFTIRGWIPLGSDVGMEIPPLGRMVE